MAEWEHEQIARGGELRIRVEEPFDDEDTEWYVLTKEKFLNGSMGLCFYFLSVLEGDANIIIAVDGDVVHQHMPVFSTEPGKCFFRQGGQRLVCHRQESIL